MTAYGWIHPVEPLRLQRTSCAVVRDFHHIHPFRLFVLGSSRQGILFNIGGKQHSVGAHKSAAVTTERLLSTMTFQTARRLPGAAQAERADSTPQGAMRPA